MVGILLVKKVLEDLYGMFKNIFLDSLAKYITFYIFYIIGFIS